MCIRCHGENKKVMHVVWETQVYWQLQPLRQSFSYPCFSCCTQNDSLREWMSVVHVIRRWKCSQMNCNCSFYCMMSLHWALHSGKGSVLVLPATRGEEFNLVDRDISVFEYFMHKSIKQRSRNLFDRVFGGTNLGFQKQSLFHKCLANRNIIFGQNSNVIQPAHVFQVSFQQNQISILMETPPKRSTFRPYLNGIFRSC